MIILFRRSRFPSRRINWVAQLITLVPNSHSDTLDLLPEA